jgi:hypothetical protein
LLRRADGFAKELLLVLDNCEHLLPGAAALAGALARSCERLAILAKVTPGQTGNGYGRIRQALRRVDCRVICWCGILTD